MDSIIRLQANQRAAKDYAVDLYSDWLTLRDNLEPLDPRIQAAYAEWRHQEVAHSDARKLLWDKIAGDSDA